MDCVIQKVKNLQTNTVEQYRDTTGMMYTEIVKNSAEMLNLSTNTIIETKLEKII